MQITSGFVHPAMRPYLQKCVVKKINELATQFGCDSNISTINQENNVISVFFAIDSKDEIQDLRSSTFSDNLLDVLNNNVTTPHASFNDESNTMTISGNYQNVLHLLHASMPHSKALACSKTNADSGF